MKCPISEELPFCALVLCTCVPLEQGAASCYPWNPAAHSSSSGAAGCGFPGRGDIPLPLLAKSRPVPHHLARSAKGTCRVHMWTSGCDYVTKRSKKQGLTPTFPILLGLFYVQTVSHCRGRPLVQAWSFGASVATGSTSSLNKQDLPFQPCFYRLFLSWLAPLRFKWLVPRVREQMNNLEWPHSLSWGVLIGIFWTLFLRKCTQAN